MNFLKTMTFGAAAVLVMGAADSKVYAAETDNPIIVVGGVTTRTIADKISAIVNSKSMFESVVSTKSTRDAAEAFCSDGPASPDILISVLPIVGSKDEVCIKNNVGKVYEGRLGYFTSVLVQNTRDDAFELTSKNIYRALAQSVPSRDGIGFVENTSKFWSDVDPALPKLPIFMALPTKNDGSREIFDAEALISGCRPESAIKLIFKAESREYRCRSLDPNKIFETSSEEARVEKLKSLPAGAVGLVSILTYEKHRAELRAVSLNGAKPTPLAINAEDYTLVLPLLIYFKESALHNANQEKADKVRAWLVQALSEETTGEDGLLSRVGIVTLPLSSREGLRNSLED